MNHEFFVLWTGPGNEMCWDGPFDEIDHARAAMPDNATASVITVPLRAMTPAEKREAMPILEGRPVTRQE
jgi:hypothetical protein